MPTISIIVPIYNVEEYLHKCIDSILVQTFKDFELILVNDGSSDNCGYICDQYATKDKRVRVIHKINGGLSDARNTGIDIAKGEYIGFVDSDDWIEPNMYEVLLNLCIENDADVSICQIKTNTNTNLIDKEANKFDLLPKMKVFNSRTAIKTLYDGELTFTAYNKLYKRDIFYKVKFPKGRIYEDAAIMYLVFHLACRIAYISCPLYNYNFREGSITRSNFSEKRFSVVSNYYETYNFMKNEYPEMCEKINYMFYLSLRNMIVDISNEKKLLKNYQYIKRISKQIKKNNREILRNKLISLKHKILAQLLAWFPYVALFAYKINLTKIKI